MYALISVFIYDRINQPIYLVSHFIYCFIFCFIYLCILIIIQVIIIRHVTMSRPCCSCGCQQRALFSPSPRRGAFGFTGAERRDESWADNEALLWGVETVQSESSDFFYSLFHHQMWSWTPSERLKQPHVTEVETHPLSDSSFIAALSKYWCWKYIFYIHSLKVRRTAAELQDLTSSFSVTLVIFFLSNRVDIQSHVIRDVCSDLELLLLPLVLTYLLEHYKKHPNRTGSLWRTHRTSSPGPLKSFPWLPLYNAQNIQKDLQNLLKDQKNLPKNPQHPHMDP